MKIIYNIVIFDLHNDMPTARLALREKVKSVYRYDASICVTMAVWTTRLRFPERTALRLTAPFKGLICDCKMQFAIEDFGFVARDGLGILDRLRPSYVGLTWNADNSLAGGAYGQNEVTALGRKTIDAINKKGVALDMAHLNDRSFWQAAELAERVLDSHCACRALNGCPRNLTDAQLRAVRARGGIIGITAAKELGVQTFCDFVANVDHAVEVAGIDAVAIGTDLFGATMPDRLTTYSHFYYVENALFKKGYSKADVDKIFYANAQRFFGHA